MGDIIVGGQMDMSDNSTAIGVRIMVLRQVMGHDLDRRHIGDQIMK
jgi:hypothetical protein